MSASSLPPSRTLLTWNDNAVALDELIGSATRSIDVFDADLRHQGWNSTQRTDALTRAMRDRRVQIRIALLDTAHLPTEMPRLVNLLKTYGHRLIVLRTRASPKPTQFMAVADRQQSIFRPVLVRSGGRYETEDIRKSSTYASTFEVVWQVGGVHVFPEAFGL